MNPQANKLFFHDSSRKKDDFLTKNRLFLKIMHKNIFSPNSHKNPFAKHIPQKCVSFYNRYEIGHRFGAPLDFVAGQIPDRNRAGW